MLALFGQGLDHLLSACLWIYCNQFDNRMVPIVNLDLVEHKSTSSQAHK